MSWKDRLKTLGMFSLYEYIPGFGFLRLNRLEGRIFLLETSRRMRNGLGVLVMFVLCFIPGVVFFYVRSLEKRVKRLEDRDFEREFCGND